MDTSTNRRRLVDNWIEEVTKHCEECEEEHDGKCYHGWRHYCQYILDMWNKLKKK